MSNKSVNQLTIERIYKISGVTYFNDDLRTVIEDVIKELYYSHGELVLRLRLNHIDRAIFKFRQAKERNYIRNTKQYFKACIVSAIQETALDDLEPLESTAD